MSFIFKLLLTALVIVVVWWVVKFRGRMSTLKAAVQAAKKVMDEESAKTSASAPTASGAKGVPVTLVPCPKCGTYIAAGSPCTCGKA